MTVRQKFPLQGAPEQKFVFLVWLTLLPEQHELKKQ